ncbi:MAG: putative sugar O-methyltransferase [Enhydrobacter sp.]|nr:MAG: putative sugar O-methyltransferase [Enhydrobacter sp.]
MGNRFKKLFSRAAVQSKDHPPSAAPLRSHTLRDNYRLTREQHVYCLSVIDRIQGLYEGAPEYVDHRGLDRELYFPGNEWADIIPVSGLRFRRAYNDINYFRLISPFAGFHLVFLDRADQRLHAEPWNGDVLSNMLEQGISDEIIAFLADNVVPADRLTRCWGIDGRVVSCADEYRQYVGNVPPRYIVRTPRLFGEIGVEVNGLLANPDIVLCQCRLNGMLCSGVFDKLDSDIARRGRVRVLEIGPGYGPLGQALRAIYGDKLEYIAVDLPGVLYYPAVYLSTLANGEGCHVLLPGDAVPESFNFLFVGNHLLEELGDRLGPIDLALNTMSFPEMSAQQVGYYAKLLKRLLRPDGIVFEENAALKPHHTDSKAVLAEVFPCRKKVSSDIVLTKNWCQDVWSSRYVPEVMNCTDTMLLR